jgi:hypothetical protein
MLPKFSVSGVKAGWGGKLKKGDAALLRFAAAAETVHGNVEDRAVLRTSLGLDNARRYVITVARFHPIKDHATAIRAFAATKLPWIREQQRKLREQERDIRPLALGLSRPALSWRGLSRLVLLDLGLLPG